MLTDIVKNIIDKYEALPDSARARVRRKVVYGINALAGFVNGTLDVCTTGYPVATIGIPLWNAGKVKEAKRMFPMIYSDMQEGHRWMVYYLMGAAIPFGIRYRQEIAWIVQYVTK